MDDERKITLALARYFVHHAEDLRGFFKGEHYFNLEGRAIEKSHRADLETFRGHAADVLAEAMLREKFFGRGVINSATYVCDPRNAKLVPVRSTQKGLIIISKTFKETEDGLLATFPLIKSRMYTGILKDRDEFKEYSETVDLGSVYDKRKGTSVKKRIDMLFAQKKW